MAALLSPQTTHCWPICLRKFGDQRTIQFFRAGTCQSRGCSTVESRLRSRQRQAEITITGYSIWCREFFCSNTRPKTFPTTTRSCSTVLERITNEKFWPRLQFRQRKFAMLIRANVSKSHRLFFLPWTSTLLLHGRFTDYATSLFLANKISIAAFIFRGHPPQFAGSRMKTKSQRSCGIGISKLSKPKIFPGGNRQTCSPARV